uniref:dCMP deaminase n=1 Tax=Zea mays TaxID=4577 RepID=A0A804QY48_MAIZE
MASTRDLAIASLSAATGAVVAAAALRLLSSRRTSSVRPQNLPAAANGSASERPLAQSPFDPVKREGYISWDDYFMAIAFLSAERSKDPNRQVGACLVSQEGIILGIGYNGFPRGCSDDKLPWAKKSASGDPLETKFPSYVVHAEVNAILNTNHASAAGQKLYVTMFPCNECAKIIIQVRKHQPQMAQIPIKFQEP